tara:strand:- start:11582 stop:12649 length:1068 start_codon:yes stop_codon:yes gene_type:complete
MMRPDLFRRLANKMALVAGGLLLSANAIAADAGGLESGASASCKSNGILGSALITDVCWSCLFPLYVFGARIGGDGNSSAPEDASPQPLCACMDSNGLPAPGIPTSMWEPARMIELTYKPGCLSSLGGLELPFDKARYGYHGGGKGLDEGSDNYQHFHYYAFPLLTVLDLFSGGRCNAGGYSDLDIMYLGEIDPTWSDDTLAYFTNPEAIAVANPAATAACAADAISSTAKKPISSMFWCAGSWGTMYPLSGNADKSMDLINGSSRRSAQVLNALHRRGLAWTTMGSENMCESSIAPTLPKQQYKFSMLHPRPESNSDHVMGESIMKWGMDRWRPIYGEDPTYLIWRWNDCCNTM